MALTKSQEAIFQKARALGGGDQAVALTDEMCNYLLARVAVDLDRSAEFSGIPSDLPPLFSDCPAADLVLSGFDTKEFFTRLVAAIPDADTYFACLASLQKARLKYERILSVQPIPTLEQVGPRALLQLDNYPAKPWFPFCSGASGFTISTIARDRKRAISLSR